MHARVCRRKKEATMAILSIVLVISSVCSAQIQQIPSDCGQSQIDKHFLFMVLLLTFRWKQSLEQEAFIPQEKQLILPTIDELQDILSQAREELPSGTSQDELRSYLSTLTKEDIKFGADFLQGLDPESANFWSYQLDLQNNKLSALIRYAKIYLQEKKFAISMLLPSSSLAKKRGDQTAVNDLDFCVCGLFSCLPWLLL